MKSITKVNQKELKVKPLKEPQATYRQETEILTPDDLRVKKVEVPDPEYKSEIPEHMKSNYFPGFPSTTLICGPPGRGKTNLLIWMLKSPKIWNGFFDEIYAYGPTVKSDKLYKTIKLKPQNIVDDVDAIIPDLDSKLKEQTAKVESNPKTAPKILFLFEDMTSFFNTVQHKPAFHRCYTQVRHLKGASVTMVHKYHAFHRTPRISSQHIIIFETNQKDIRHVYEEFGPRCLTEEQFNMLVDYALTPTEKEPKPFFYINTIEPDERLRYRKNFTEIMEIDTNVIRENPVPKKRGRPRRKPRERSMSPKKEKTEPERRE